MFLIFPILQSPSPPKLLLHSNSSFWYIFPSSLPIFCTVLPLFLSMWGLTQQQSQIWRFKHCHPLCCMVGMAVGAVPLLTQPGSMTVSFLSYFLSLKSIWFSFCALQCQLINHSASSLMLDKMISLSLPAFHKASMYRIKFVVLFPDKNELR